MTRARPLPSASRSAISFRRAVPRASIMLVRLRHAMSSTSDAMPMSSAESTVSSESLCGLVLMPRASQPSDE